jgi:hypothetical protein
VGDEVLPLITKVGMVLPDDLVQGASLPTNSISISRDLRFLRSMMAVKRSMTRSRKSAPLPGAVAL